MAKHASPAGGGIAEIYARHVKTVYRLCFAYMKNPHDAEDAVQDTFWKMLRRGVVFESEEHEKAWLIRTAANVCKDALKHWWSKREALDGHEEGAWDGGAAAGETIEAVLSLPDKHKALVLLYYYEGYTSVEIAKTLRMPQSTVRSRLAEARKLLRKKLGGDFDEE